MKHREETSNRALGKLNNGWFTKEYWGKNKAELEKSKKLREEILGSVTSNQKEEFLELFRDKEKSKEVQEFNYTYKKTKSEVCLTIPKELKTDDIPAYMWDNANTTGGDSNEYVHFRIYDNSFKYISANKDINKGVWSDQYKTFVRYSEEEFIAELKRIYFILLELNRGRYGEDNHVINVFFRRILIHLNEHSKYGFNRLYILNKLGNWAYLLNRTKKTELESIKDVLGARGSLVRERDFQLKKDTDIVQIENEYNSFLSRLSEDRKRHSVKKFISEDKLGDIKSGYLLPITSDDVKICRHTQLEIKKLVTKYNKELTGGTYNNHLDTYVMVAGYVSLCYSNYLVNEKMCNCLYTVYIDTYIGCTKIYTKFIESKYFPKVSDVVRELNINNRRAIKTILTSIKQLNTGQIVADAEALIMMAEGYGFELNNIESNGKSRLSIVPKEYSKEDLIRELKLELLQNNLNLPNIDIEDAFDLNEPIDYSNADKRDYFQNNNFDVQGWKFSDSLPKVIPIVFGNLEDMVDHFKDISSAYAEVVKLERKVEPYTSEGWIDLE